MMLNELAVGDIFKFVDDGHLPDDMINTAYSIDSKTFKGYDLICYDNHSEFVSRDWDNNEVERVEA